MKRATLCLLPALVLGGCFNNDNHDEEAAAAAAGHARNAAQLAEIQARQANVDRLLATGACTDCDLRGTDLSGLNLAGTMLAGADLEGADLTGSSFRGANLAGANMAGVRICNTTTPAGQVDNSGC